MDSSVSPKDEIWFLRVCHHISTGLYLFLWVVKSCAGLELWCVIKAWTKISHQNQRYLLNVDISAEKIVNKGLWNINIYEIMLEFYCYVETHRHVGKGECWRKEAKIGLKPKYGFPLYPLIHREKNYESTELLQ